MASIAEAERIVFSLNDEDRATLVGKILRSLPLYAEDAGLAEALRRDRQMDEDPESIITIEQLDEMIANRPQRAR